MAAPAALPALPPPPVPAPPAPPPPAAIPPPPPERPAPSPPPALHAAPKPKVSAPTRGSRLPVVLALTISVLLLGALLAAGVVWRGWVMQIFPAARLLFAALGLA